jgi:hypothetical protein
MTGSFIATLSRGIESALERTDPKHVRLATWAVLAIGVLVRVIHYAGGRSLWRDEAALAINVVRTSELGGILGDEQMAPYGFVAVSKYLFGLLGGNDLALRLLPFVASLVALLLFHRLARRLLDDFGTFVAVALMALAPQLVFYAAEFKPYELDALGAVVVLAAAERYRRAPSAGSLALLASIGIVGVWFSYPMAFVLGAVGSVLFFEAVLSRQAGRSIAIAGVSVAWLASFSLEYWVMTHDDSANLSYMTEYWASYFITVFPTSLAELRKLQSTVVQFLTEGVGLYYYKVALLACLAGLVVLWRRVAVWAWLLALPAVLMAAASTLHRYPPPPRLLLFLVPVCFLLIPAALSYVRARPFRYRNTLAVAFAAVFLWPMVRALVPNVVERPAFAREEMVPILQQVADHATSDDRVYVYYGAEQAYRWYAARFGLASHPTLWGRSPRQGWDYYVADAAELAQCGRTWLVFSHLTALAGFDEKRFLLFLADTLGRRVETFEATGASAYLYDFSSQPSPAEPVRLIHVPEASLPPYGWSVDLRQVPSHDWSCGKGAAPASDSSLRSDSTAVGGRADQ